MNDPKPGIVRIITRLNIGGPARQALLLTRALRDTFDPILVAGTGLKDEGELTDPRVTVERAPLVRPLSPSTDRRAYAALKDIIRARRPRIVHTHMAKAGALGRRAAISSGVDARTVHTFHGHVLDGYFNPLVQRAFIQAERWLAKRTDVLVAVSTEVRDALVDLGIGEPDRWVVVPLGFELDDLLASAPSGKLRAHLGLGPDVALVGVLGRLAAIKDHACLIEAIEPLDDVHLAILGDGELRNELEGLVRDKGLDGRVHFAGWWLDVPAAMADLDVVALTSRNEGTPVSLIEALAASVPVVATDVGGVRSVVEDGVSGFVVPPKNPAAVSDALRALLADDRKRGEMGAAGRSFVRDRFSSQRLINDIRSLYEDLLT